MLSDLGGVEVVLHNVSMVLSRIHSDRSLAILTMNFTNAFKLMDKSSLLYEVSLRCPYISLYVEFLYGQTLRLHIGGMHI